MFSVTVAVSTKNGWGLMLRLFSGWVWM